MRLERIERREPFECLTCGDMVEVEAQGRGAAQTDEGRKGSLGSGDSVQDAGRSAGKGRRQATGSHLTKAQQRGILAS